METFLYIVFFVSCIVLVIAVLLQPGKTDAGALFTSNVSSAAMNPRGTQSVLSKLTIATATIFMLSALLLSLPAVTGKVSVLETQGPTAGSTDPNTANSNTANSNVANAESNSNEGETKKDEDPKTGDDSKTEDSEKKSGETEENKDSDEKAKKPEADSEKSSSDDKPEKDGDKKEDNK